MKDYRELGLPLFAIEAALGHRKSYDAARRGVIAALLQSRTPRIASALSQYSRSEVSRFGLVNRPSEEIHSRVSSTCFASAIDASRLGRASPAATADVCANPPPAV